MKLRACLSVATLMGVSMFLPISSAEAAPRKYNATVLSDPRCTSPAKAICVDKGARAVYAVERGKVVLALSARFGRRSMPTREGQFTVYWKNADHVSSIYGSSMPYAMFFSGGQAIHFSSDFANRGYVGGSHGCVNVRSLSGARWLFNWAPTGTRVLVTD